MSDLDDHAADALRYMLIGMRLTLAEATALALVARRRTSARRLAAAMFGSTRQRRRARTVLRRLAERGLIRPVGLNRWEPTPAGRRWLEQPNP